MKKLFILIFMLIITLNTAQSASINKLGNNAPQRTKSLLTKRVANSPMRKYATDHKAPPQNKMHLYDRTYERYGKDVYNKQPKMPSAAQRPFLSRIRPGRNHDNPAAYGFGDNTQVNKFIWHKQQQPQQREQHYR